MSEPEYNLNIDMRKVSSIAQFQRQTYQGPIPPSDNGEETSPACYHDVRIHYIVLCSAL